MTNPTTEVDHIKWLELTTDKELLVVEQNNQEGNQLIGTHAFFNRSPKFHPLVGPVECTTNLRHIVEWATKHNLTIRVMAVDGDGTLRDRYNDKQYRALYDAIPSHLKSQY